MFAHNWGRLCETYCCCFNFFLRKSNSFELYTQDARAEMIKEHRDGSPLLDHEVWMFKPYDNFFGSFFPVKTFMSRYFFIGHRTLDVDFTERGCEQKYKTLKHLNCTYLSRGQEAC